MILLAVTTIAQTSAPSTFTVTFSTDVPGAGGQIPVQVTRSWAPLGADRFYAAVRAGFYNHSAFFRVVAPNTTGCSLTCGGIVQFGISGSKRMNKQWLHAPIKDDPVTQPNVAGVINFADAGPNTRTTELVFMLGDNLKQGKAGFAPFGRIASKAGLEVARAIFNPTPCCTVGSTWRGVVGDAGCDPNKNCSYGVNQGTYEALGNSWINATYPGINFIIGAIVSSSSDDEGPSPPPVGTSTQTTTTKAVHSLRFAQEHVRMIPLGNSSCSSSVVAHSDRDTTHPCTGGLGTTCDYTCEAGWIPIGKHVCQNYTGGGKVFIRNSFFGGRCDRLCTTTPDGATPMVQHCPMKQPPIRTNSTDRTGPCLSTMCVANPTEALRNLALGNYQVWMAARHNATGIFCDHVDMQDAQLAFAHSLGGCCRNSRLCSA
jgi:cyclophilin family peptidyl-prolyl cis-trans isomerase